MSETKTTEENPNPETNPDPKGGEGGKGGDPEAARTRIRLKELEKTIEDLKGKNSAYEKEKAEAEKAKLSEIDRLKLEKEGAETRTKELESKLGSVQKESSFKIAALQAGCVDPEAAVKLADLSAFKESDPEAIKASIEDFKKARPYLFGANKMANIGTGGGEPNPNVTKAEDEKKRKLEEAAKNKDPMAALKAVTAVKK